MPTWGQSSKLCKRTPSPIPACSGLIGARPYSSHLQLQGCPPARVATGARKAYERSFLPCRGGTPPPNASRILGPDPTMPKRAPASASGALGAGATCAHDAPGAWRPGPAPERGRCPGCGPSPGSGEASSGKGGDSLGSLAIAMSATRGCLRGDRVSEGMINGFPIYRLTTNPGLSPPHVPVVQRGGAGHALPLWRRALPGARAFPSPSRRGLPVETPAVRR